MNFINFHILHTAPYSSMNRDDSGAPKTMVFGGAERVRLSSQALKRAARVTFEAESSADRTYRSKAVSAELESLVLGAVQDTGLDLSDEQASALRKAVAKEVSSLTKGEDGKKETLVWLAERDLVGIARKVASRLTFDAEALASIDKVLRESFQSRTHSLSIAAFGRMFANRPDVQTEAAVQVAHAFTTHPALIELDYFTAVDDLRTEDSGAGHLDVSLFSSGTFYRHFNIDRRQLMANWLDASDQNARERLQSLLQALCLSLPRGKANSTAPAGFPALILVEVSRQPASYASAFEAPVVGSVSGGFEAESIAKLVAHSDRMRQLFGDLVLGDRKIFGLDAGEISLQELFDWVVDHLLEEVSGEESVGASSGV